MSRLLKIVTVVVAFGIILSILGHNSVLARKTKNKTIPVVVSILPQKYFASRIGGNIMDVVVLVSPGQSPAMYTLTPNEITRILNSEAWFTARVPFEKKFLTTAVKYRSKMNIVPTQERVGLLPMDSTVMTIDGEKYEDSHEYAEGEPDPHFWLDPSKARIMAENILLEYNGIAPKHSEAFEANFRPLAAELDSIDAVLRERFADDAGSMFMIFHPSLGYFARAYGLKQVAIEESGKQASAKRISKIVKFAKEKGVKYILVQKQFPVEQAETIAQEIGGEVIVVDPLSADYFTNLSQIADAVEKALVSE